MNTESENLAERLRTLYQMYNCENELPAHDDLVAKLDCVDPELRESATRELDREYVYPISIEKAKEEAKMPLSEQVKALCAETLIGGVLYAVEKMELEKNVKRFPFLLHAIYGGIRAFPSAVKTAFLEQEDPQQVMEDWNKGAAQYFRGFKNNVAHYLKS